MPNEPFDPSRANEPDLTRQSKARPPSGDLDFSKFAPKKAGTAPASPPAPGHANALADAEFLDLSGTCIMFGAGNPGIATRFCGACLSTLKSRTLRNIRADWTGRF